MHLTIPGKSCCANAALRQPTSRYRVERPCARAVRVQVRVMVSVGHIIIYIVCTLLPIQAGLRRYRIHRDDDEAGRQSEVGVGSVW